MLFLMAQTRGDHTLTGQVVGKQYQQPIPGANIYLEERPGGAVTNAQGGFTLTGLQSGSYTLHVSHIGYRRYSKKVQVRSGVKNHVMVYLADTVYQSDPVEIRTATGEGNRQPHRVSTITARDIRLAPALSTNQLIQYAPGVLISNTTGLFASRVTVTLRGMPANDQGRTLVVMDGIPMNKADGGSVNWNMLDKNSLEEINIIKGPGPAKYGSGAMGGVIELKTKYPSDSIAGNAGIEYGSYNTLAAELGVQGSARPNAMKGRYFWGLQAQTRHSDGYITTPDVYRTIEDTILIPTYLKEYILSLKSGYLWKEGQHVLELRALAFSDMRGTGVQVFDDHGSYIQHRNLAPSLHYKGRSGHLRYTALIYSNLESYFRVYEYMREGEYQLYEADAARLDHGMNADLSYAGIPHHQVGFGISLKTGAVKGTDTYYTTTDIIHNQGNMDIISFYAQDEVNLAGDRLKASAGLRYDHARFHNAAFSIDYPSYSIEFYKDYAFSSMPDKSWTALTPRFSLMYSPNQHLSSFISYAWGFRAPMLDDMCRTGTRRGTFAVANPDLQPELVKSLEAGGDVALGKGITLSLSAYRSIGEDFMYYVSTGDTVNMGYRLAPVISKQNIGKVSIQGTEAEVKIQATASITAFVNHAYTDARILEHQINNAAVDSNLTGRYLTDIPSHKLSAGISWQTTGLGASLRLVYHGKTWINEYNMVDTEYFQARQFDDYVLLNLRLEKKVYRFIKASLQIDNLLNTRFIDSRIQQNPGRMIFVKIFMDF